MDKHEFVLMPQFDTAQLEQIVREYNAEPAKGLTHGVQKDAIQNGFGARAVAREKQACKDWCFTFELLKINGSEALVFWDEGTCGLTGDILTDEEITIRMADKTLGPTQRLSRFLARFVSGDNIGPGTFGRGKLIFHGASKDKSILVDSLRNDDNKYIAFDRRLIKGRLMQRKIPFEGDEAKIFIKDQTNAALMPITNYGTRIVILNVEDELIEAVKLTFSESSGAFESSFAKMIEDTWWEIIHKFDAKIFIKLGNKFHQVKLHEPLTTIINAIDGDNGVRVYAKENIPVGIGTEQHRIKELRFTVLPEKVDEKYREIWLQRKRMKIGDISKHFNIHPKINGRFNGYLVLEPSLEDVVEQAEGTTHYGFNLTASGIRQLRSILKDEIRNFERQLGLIAKVDDVESRKRLLDSMKELNEQAVALGLVTKHGTGITKSNVDILVKDFNKPNNSSLCVEIGDTVGPITYKLVSRHELPIKGIFNVVVKHKGLNVVDLYNSEIGLLSEDSKEIAVSSFTIDSPKFSRGFPIEVVATYYEEKNNRKLGSSIRRLYVGYEPDKPSIPVKLQVNCNFPSANTRRVEMSDFITNIRAKITNTMPFDIVVDVTSSVRHLENRQTGRQTIPLYTLLDKKNYELKAQSDYVINMDNLQIVPEIFSSVQNTKASIPERSCDIYTLVRLSKASEELGKPRKYKLNKASVKFYFEVDPPGKSIFQDIEQADEPNNGKQSWHESSGEAGYKFILNVGHNAYKFIQNVDESEMTKLYEQEQMLRQAYLIAFENEVYRGPAEEFEGALRDQNITTDQTAEIFNTIIGCALNTLLS